MTTGPAAKSSGSVTIRRRGSELSPWLVKGICGPCPGTIHTFASAGSTPSLNHSVNSLGTVENRACRRIGFNEAGMRRYFGDPEAEPKQHNEISEESVSPKSPADHAHHLIAPCRF